MNTEIRQQISNSLNNFSGVVLKEASINLLNILGYKSEKQLDIVNTPDAFIDMFDNRERKFDKKKGQFSKWHTIDFLFQLTDDEIKNNSSSGKLFNPGFDSENFKSYIFFALDLKENHYTRTDLSKITREINLLFDMPVMLLIRHNDMLTFSIIDRRINKKDQNRDVLEKVKLIKDINCRNPHRAHIEILCDLALSSLITKHQCRNFNQLHKAWRKTLDSSELNKRFFKEVANWYFWAKQNVTFPGDAEKYTEIRNATSVIRMITRLIFVWFLKEKGLIPGELFNENRIKQILNNLDSEESTYYKAILQNLFFATLSQEMNTPEKPNKRKFRGKNNHPRGRDGNHMIHNVYRYEDYFINSEKALDLFSTTPFLNGGLFECLDTEDPNKPNKRIRIDGFSDHKDNELFVPNFLFFSEGTQADLNKSYGTKNKQYEVRGLINILDHYKFTIDENTPIEEDVALDPELLGKVFENLLASYNPETETTARKQTGSFYTPREIVDYMVDESLKATLSKLVSQRIDCTNEDIKTGLDILFAYTEKDHAFNDEEITAIIEVVAELSILDPACGSGAFPMGILHKLVYILGKLDHDNKKWRELHKQRAIKETEKAYNLGDREQRHQRIQEIENAFDFNTSDYGRKLFLIENCIYGVDVQPIAVQIAKLRFFISLVVDQIIDSEKENRGILPLPNLETKFVSADSLIGLEKPSQGHLSEMWTKELEKELLNVRHKHFNAKTLTTKRKYRDKDKEIRKQIADALTRSGWKSDIANRLANWDPYSQNMSATFFDPEWMFGIKKGFDIVIGNPPYVQIQKFSGKQQQKDWEKQGYKTFIKTGDVYCLFYEKGNMLLKNKGVLAYITSNKWMRAKYGQSLREYFINNVNILTLIDFGDSQIFESATTYTCINIFLKEKSGKKTSVWDLSKTYEAHTSLESMLDENKGCEGVFNEDSYIIVPTEQAEIKNRIESIGTQLKDWDVSINYGVKTGFNDAFIINDVKKDELIKADAKSAEIIKPVLRGRDIKRYKAEFAGLWLINTHNGTRFTSPVKVDDYPAVKKHLDNYCAKLEKRQDKGITPYNLRNCAYLDDFEKEKIIWLEMSPRPNFTYSDKTMFVLNTAYILRGEHLKYILTVLNSNIINYYFPVIAADVRGKTLRFIKQYVEQIPIPEIPYEKMIPYEILADCILFAKENNMDQEASTLESVIDGMVYDLYFEEDMKASDCYISDRIREVIKPFKDNDTDEFKAKYVKKLADFCNEDKTVYRGLIYRRTVKAVKIITGADKNE